MQFTELSFLFRTDMEDLDALNTTLQQVFSNSFYFLLLVLLILRFR